MTEKPAITERSTKADLFRAYQELKEKMESLSENQLPLAQREEVKKEEEKILEKTATLLPQNLDDNIAALNKKTQEVLNSLRDKLIGESEKLGQLRQAIVIETKKLEETRHIKLADDALQTLIADYELKEKELTKRLKEAELSLNEEMAEKRKIWEREQEEYKYNLKIERKKDDDLYELERAKNKAAWQEEINKKENELKERAENLNERLKEFDSLKAEINGFTAKLEAAVEKAKKEQAAVMQKDFAVQKQLNEQQHDSEKNILQAKIENLQETLKNQNLEIASLKKSLSEANQRAQNLATVIVENASGRLAAKPGEEREEKKAE